MLTIAILLLASAPHSGGTDANGCHRDRKTGTRYCDPKKRAALLQLIGWLVGPHTIRTALLRGLLALLQFVRASRGTAASWIAMGWAVSRRI